MAKHTKFQAEPNGYDKTILSELQGAWILLREAVVENGSFSGAEGLRRRRLKMPGKIMISPRLALEFCGLLMTTF